jgi:hypothetical protein|tara:strand:- start:309 stop:437 length:129 start_codon:yes stop_codon:yes gene_type:complete
VTDEEVAERLRSLPALVNDNAALVRCGRTLTFLFLLSGVACA